MEQVKIDVEQQLQAWRQKQKNTTVPESFIKWEHFQSAQFIIYPLVGATVVLCALIMLLPFVGRKPNGIKYRYAENVRSTRALFFAKTCGSAGLSVFLVVWLLICALNAVFALMREFSINPSLMIHETHSLNDFFRPAALLFILQSLGIASLVIHVLFTAKLYYVGCFAAFVPFAVNLYQSAALNGSDVNQVSIGFISIGLLFSLIMFMAFITPYVKHEYRMAVREINMHTTNVLGNRKKVMESTHPRKRA